MAAVALVALVALGATGARAQDPDAIDPDAFDPVLDAGPDGSDERPLPAEAVGSPGAWVSTHGGIYFGAVQSYLTAERSMLRDAGRFAVGFGFGVRTRGFIDIGVDVDLGLGQTYEPVSDDTVFAFDLIVEPRVVAHLYETESFTAYAGLGALAVLFDLETAGLNQAGMGPSVVAGLGWRLDRHSLLYVEASGCAFYDALAYHFRAPTDDEIKADPGAPPVKVEGEWFPVFRLTVGYRLTAL